MCCPTATFFYHTDHFKLGDEAVPNRKPRSEWRGWETSFKQALLLRAEGAIRAFFDGYCRGDTASGVRSVVIARRYFFVGYCRGDIASGVRSVVIARRFFFVGYYLDDNVFH